MERPLYRVIASTIQARKTCQERNNTEWFQTWADVLDSLCDCLPSGSGFDNGTTLDLERSHAEKLVFRAPFHHMNDTGYYCGWTEHTITVTPSFDGINLRISGPNRNDIKDHIHETFHYALTRDVSYETLLPRFPEYAVTSKWENEDGTPSECYMAWYSNGVRFWNNFDGAKKHAVSLMESAK